MNKFVYRTLITLAWPVLPLLVFGALIIERRAELWGDIVGCYKHWPSAFRRGEKP